MRLVAATCVILVAFVLFPLPASTAAANLLQVTAKTANSVSLDWSGWSLTNLKYLTLYRDRRPLQRWSQSLSSFTDTSVVWGTTFTYHLRAVFTDGQTLDTNTVWVTTDALTTRWNIVVILTDDQRWDTLQYMPQTTQLIAQPGVTFTNAFASTPECCPSRAGLLTGLFSHNHGVLSNDLGAPAFKDGSTLATWLTAAGYRTSLIGKYLNRYDALPQPYQPPGWSDWHAFKEQGYFDYTLIENGSEVVYGSAPEEYSTRVLAAKAADFVQTTPTGQPFFLLFAPGAPHLPTIYETDDASAFADLAPWRPPSFNKADVSDKPSWVRALPLMTGDEIARFDELRIRQLRTLRSIDRAVKTLYDAIVLSGRLDSTIFIFTSDNAWAWGEYRWAGKGCAYDECTRVPLVIRVPSTTPRTDNRLITLVDLVPSIAAWAGILHPKVNGASFARLMAVPETPWRSAILIELLAAGEKRSFSALRTSFQLYIEYGNGEREFYDLLTDPYALTNAVDNPTYGSVIAALRTKLKAFRKQ